MGLRAEPLHHCKLPAKRKCTGSMLDEDQPETPTSLASASSRSVVFQVYARDLNDDPTTVCGFFVVCKQVRPSRTAGASGAIICA